MFSISVKFDVFFFDLNKEKRKSPIQLATLTLKFLILMLCMTQRREKFYFNPGCRQDSMWMKTMFSYPVGLPVLVSHKDPEIYPAWGLHGPLMLPL